MRLSAIRVIFIVLLTFIQPIWSDFVEKTTITEETTKAEEITKAEETNKNAPVALSDLICPPHEYVTANNETIYWQKVEFELKNPDRTFYMMKSEPMCLAEDKIPVHRTCEYREASPLIPPECASTRSIKKLINATLPFCPEPFTAQANKKGEYICIHISEPKKWEEDCYKWGVSDSPLHVDEKDLDAIQQFLQEKNFKHYWLPLRSYGHFDPFLWHLPDIYGHVFDEDEFSKWHIKGQRHPGGNCVALSNHGRNIIIENCTNKYPTVCIYNAKKSYIKLACPEKSVAMRIHGEYDQCLQVTESTTKCERFFQMDTMNKNIFYRQAFSNIFNKSDMVHFTFKHELSTLKPKPDNYLCLSSIPGFNPNDFKWNYQKWLNVQKAPEEVFWSFFMHSYDRIETENNYTVLDSRGQWVTYDNYNCKACVNVVKMFTPELHVVFHQDHQVLELIVYSEEFLWRKDDDDSGVTCFTDAGYNTLLSNVEKDLVWSDKIKTTDIIGQNNKFSREYITKSIYQLEIKYDTPGHYWCEGLSIPDFKVVKSPRVVAYEEDDGTVFSFRALMNCSSDCKKYERGFTKKDLKEIAKDFKKLLQKFDKDKELIEKAKVMRIQDYPQDSSKLEVIFHVLVEYDNFTFPCPQNITHHICTLHGIQKDLEIIAKNASDSKEDKKFKNITVRHTAFCLPYNSSQTNQEHWVSAGIGERSVLQHLCLTTNLLPDYRVCRGDFIIGAQWDEDHTPMCHEMKVPEITQRLFELDNSDNDASTIIEGMQEITEVDAGDIIPADLFFVGQLTRRLATEVSNGTEFGLEDVEKIIAVLSHTTEVNEKTAKASQILNSTNTLLDMSERIITSVLLEASISNKTFDGRKTNELLGVIELKAKNLITFVINPFVANVTGIALYRSTKKSNYIEDLIPRYLYANQDATSLLMDDEGLEIATFLPGELLRRINEINQTAAVNTTVGPKPPLRIFITFCGNDRLFQDNGTVSYFRANGRVVSVSIPGYGPNLPSFFPLIFRATHEITNKTNACGFWDFTPTNKSITSEWATRGCEFLSISSNLDDPVVLCGCSHLTHFAFLLTGVFKYDLTPEQLIVHKKHLFALDVITIVGCSLSLAGIIGIWITAMFFKTWREKAGSKVLLQLSVAIALQMLLFLFINAEYVMKDIKEENKKIICITLGALLQYSVLIVFSWMLITGYLQYLRYVVVFGNPKPAHFTLKSIIIGWIMPTIPVFLVLGLDMESYLPPNWETEDFYGSNCYPQGYSLYFGIVLPVVVIFSVNLCFYIVVIYNITRRMDSSSKKKDTKIQRAQLRLSVFLFFLLGMSWIFGFFIYIGRSPHMIFEYLFCITATIQGFVLFAYFVILDPATRKLWEKFFISLKCGRSEKLT